MNANKRVLQLVMYSVGLFLAISLMALVAGWSWLPFNRINLLSELWTKQEAAPNTPSTDSLPAPDSSSHLAPHPLFQLYQRPEYITHFYSDTLRSSLPQLAARLHQLKKTGKGKIRIAYFGDSMIEGDLMTQTLRELLQNQFGGDGVGFVPITSQVAHFRKTVTAAYSGGWQDDNFKEGKNKKLYLSGHSFHTDNDWVTLTDQTIHHPDMPVEKSLLCGAYGNEVAINVNQNRFLIHPKAPVNRIVLSNDARKTVALGVATPQLPVYGISFESENGVFVDNFSFRGISGIELARMDSAFLRAIATSNPYDLIVFQYGVNLLFRPKDKQFGWYADIMKPVVRKFTNCFAPAEVVLVSTADRAFRQAGEYKTAIGVDSLVKTQALIAEATGTRFYNQFASMGGTNSIVAWAKAKPPMANQDYVHPNFRGAEVLAQRFYDALIREYEKYVNTLNE